MKRIKKIIRKIIGNFALWLISLLREAEKYADKNDVEFTKELDKAEKTIKDLINGK